MERRREDWLGWGGGMGGEGVLGKVRRTREELRFDLV